MLSTVTLALPLVVAAFARVLVPVVPRPPAFANRKIPPLTTTEPVNPVLLAPRTSVLGPTLAMLLPESLTGPLKVMSPNPPIAAPNCPMARLPSNSAIVRLLLNRVAGMTEFLRTGETPFKTRLPPTSAVPLRSRAAKVSVFTVSVALASAFAFGVRWDRVMLVGLTAVM